MLNPHGYTVAANKSAGCDLNSLMKSVKTNITENEVQVQEFINKETNENRRRELQTIFEQAKALKMRFDNHRMSEIDGSADYRSMASNLCKLIQKQRHAGRKLFVSTVSNPLLGFDCVTFFYYPTIRGVKCGQLQLMDDFIARLKGIKTEYTTEIKPTIGLVNVPKSEKSRGIQGKNKRKVKISHVDFKNDVIASLASVLTSHKVPIQWLDHNIDTSEMPNAFTKKANILLNVNLVVEMTSEPIEIADPPPFISKIKPADSSIVDIKDDDDDDDDWSTDGWFDAAARELIDKSKNDSASKKDCKHCRQYENSPNVIVNKMMDDITMDISFYNPNNQCSDLSADSDVQA